MATKQHSFKLNLEATNEKKINDFLTGKPTTHIVVEALTLYMRFEEARQVAIDNAIRAIAVPQPRTAARALVEPNDDIEEFEL